MDDLQQHMDEVERMVDDFIFEVMNHAIFADRDFLKYTTLFQEKYEVLVKQCAAYLKLPPQIVSLYMQDIVAGKIISFQPGRVN